MFLQVGNGGLGLPIHDNYTSKAHVKTHGHQLTRLSCKKRSKFPLHKLLS